MRTSRFVVAGSLGRSPALRRCALDVGWFVAAEGYITDFGDGDVAPLRHWFSERTHWLAEVFGRLHSQMSNWTDR